MQETSILIKRDQSVDVIKTIAIICVLTIHASTGGYSNPIMSFDWWSSLFWGSITRAAVPLFLMCSGTLMLDPQRNISLKRLYTHNILRLIVAMFIWSMFYHIFHQFTANAISYANFIQAVKNTLAFNQEFHLYYIHIMLLFYVCIPIIRILTQNAAKLQLQYFLFLWLTLGIIYPVIRQYWPFNILQGIPTQYAINMAYASIGYGVAGYYIKKYLIHRIYYVICLIGGFGIVYGMTTLLTIKHGTLYEVFLGGMTPGVCLLAIGIFGLATHKKYIASVSKIAEYISKASFCIFLVHVMFNYIFSSFGLTVAILPCVISIPILVCLNFALSYIVYLILSHVPIANRYLI